MYVKADDESILPYGEEVQRRHTPFMTLDLSTVVSGIGIRNVTLRYYPGDTVIDRTADGTLSDIPEYPGYEYAWDWGIYDEHGKPVQNPDNIIMDSSDMWVIGNYVPKEYNLTIEYGSPVNETVTEKVRFGQTYAVESPNIIKGYLADTAVVTGIMPAEDLAIKVNYTATENKLNIVHIYKDAEGNGFEFYINTFMDYRLRTIQMWILSSLLEQAVGRARLL